MVCNADLIKLICYHTFFSIGKVLFGLKYILMNLKVPTRAKASAGNKGTCSVDDHLNMILSFVDVSGCLIL